MSLISVRKKGFLHKLPVKGFVKKWHRRWFVLHATTIEGVVRLEYYDSESFEATAMGKRTVPLRQCRDLGPATGNKTHPYVFQFTSHMGHHVFAAESHTDMEEWMSAIQEAVMEDKQRNRRSKKTQSMIVQHEKEGPVAPPSLSVSGTAQVPLTVAAQSDPPATDAYEPNNSGTYRVTLEQNESAKRRNLMAMIYNLEITPNHITLVAADSGAELAQWGYRQIRTYGKSTGKFNFECGRLAPTGAGNFSFKTTCSKEIFGVVHRNIKRIRKEMEDEAQQKAGGRRAEKAIRKIPKQASLPEQSQPPEKPTSSASAATAEKKDFRTHQPSKPVPYKPKKKSREDRRSLDTGTYRQFGNPPSYEEIEAAGPSTFEPTKPSVAQEEKGLYVTVDDKKPQPNEKARDDAEVAALYSTVDKSKKKKKSQDTLPSKAAENSTEKTADFLNDPFFAPPSTSSPIKEANKDKKDPFQLDPFLFSPQPGANSFDLPPGADPFSLPPLPTNTSTNGGLGTNVLDDLEKLDASLPPSFDVFNFDTPSTGAASSANGATNIPPSTNRTSNLAALPNRAGNMQGNQIGTASSNPSGFDFNIDLMDDRLFDTLAQMDIQQDGGSSEKQDLGKAGAGGGGSGGGQHQRAQKMLSQKEFDDMWDGISAAMPTTDT